MREIALSVVAPLSKRAHYKVVEGYRIIDEEPEKVVKTA